MRTIGERRGREKGVGEVRREGLGGDKWRKGGRENEKISRTKGGED